MSEWSRMGFGRLRPLGGGGDGDVYLADMEGLDGVRQRVVIKLARPGSIDSERHLKEEARRLATLDHESIVRVLDYGRRMVDGYSVPYLVLEYGGIPLTRVRRSMGGRIEPGLATYVALRVCSALQYAHEREIIHRDIKPANVLIGHQGRIRLIDFGIAKAPDRLHETTNSALIKGTVSYVAPEMLRRVPPDGRADLWALGVLLYENLTGAPPWTSDREGISKIAWQKDVFDQILHEDPPPLPPELVPENVADVVYRLLEKDPKDRYADAGEAYADLERVCSVTERIARQELGHQATAAEDATTRVDAPLSGASTLPVDAKRRPPPATAAVKLSASTVDDDDLLSDELDSLDPADQEEADIHTDLIPRDQLGLPGRRRPWAKVAAIAGIVLVSGWLGFVAVGRRDPVATAEEATPAAAPPAEAPDAPSGAGVLVARTHGVVGQEAVGTALPQPGDTPAPEATHEEDAPPSARPKQTSQEGSERDVLGQAEKGAPDVATADSRTAGEGSRRAHGSSDGEANPRSTRDRGKREATKKRASLVVVVDPIGSYVSRNGGPYQQAPTTFHDLKPGTHLLKVGMRPGEPEKTVRAKLAPGDNTVRVELVNPFAAGSTAEEPK